MKRTFKKAAACALALTLVFGGAAANVTAGGTLGGAVISASAATTYDWSTNSGTFTVTELDKPTYSYGNGSGQWVLSDNNTTLTITGTGSTPFFSSDSGMWHGYKSTVTKIIIGDGITRLNARCFQGFTALTTVELPNSLEAIGYAAFDRCSALNKITIPKSVTTVEIAAFSHGNSNFEIELSDSNQKISDLNNAFYSTSTGDETSNLDDIAVISGVTLTNETIDYYLNMFPNAEVGGRIKITPSMQLSADGSRFTIKGYVPLTTKRTINNYSVTLGNTTPF